MKYRDNMTVRKSNNNLFILYRKSLTDAAELEVIKKYFPDENSDCMVGIQNKVVLGRYSCVPFYSEVQQGLAVQNSRLINSLSEHLYIANFDYYWDIENYTPKTWFSLVGLQDSDGPFVVKGATNSKKHQWNTMMFAPTKADAIRIAVDLKNDYFLGSQDIITRKYEPLIKLGDSINGLSFTNEWRFFFYKEELLSYGFYWSECDIKGSIDEAGIDFAKKISKIVSKRTSFYTIDIGQKENGEWTVIELNDGQMAGFSDNDAHKLYSGLSKLKI